MKHGQKLKLWAELKVGIDVHVVAANVPDGSSGLRWGWVEPSQVMVAMLNAKLVVVMEMAEMLECWVR